MFAKSKHMLGVAAGCAVVGVACVTQPPQQAGRPECPNHDIILTVTADERSRVISYGEELPVSGPITGIPEFHDCQRFVIRGDTDFDYGQLVAIFASDTLGRWNQFPQRRAQSVALIYNYGDGDYGEEYAPLGIQKFFNCLYAVSPDSNLVRAWMVPVGTTAEACDKDLDPAEMPPTAVPLEVTIDHFSRFDAEDYPAVARWDYDRENALQYIGFACRPFGWCNAHAPGLYSPSPTYTDPMGPASQARVIEIKGWYDHQRLAQATGAPVGLSDLTGNLIPAPDLGTLNDTIVDFATWRHVAWVQLDAPDDAYLKKYGYVGNGLGPPTQVVSSKIYLCQGSRDSCKVDDPALTCDDPTNHWWAKIESPSGAVYRCVTRRGHEDARDSGRVSEIPATARWRWAVDDEKAWLRCGFGCCEAQ